MLTALPRAAHPPPDVQNRHLSYSALRLYASCPLRYYFKYVVGLPETTVTSSLVFGSAIHGALQFHFEQRLAGNAAPDLDALLDAFWEDWRTREPAAIQFNKGEDLNSVGVMADRLLRTFQTSSLAQTTGRILGVEEEVRGVLVPGVPELLARIDLILEQDDAIEVYDFKTARSAWGSDEASGPINQLVLYSELVRPLAGGKPLRLAFAVLTKTKTPEFSVHPVAIDPGQVDRTRRVIERIWHAIQAAHIYPNPSPINCTQCPFKEPCVAWAG